MMLAKLLSPTNSAAVVHRARRNEPAKTKTRFEGFVEIVQEISAQAVPFIELSLWAGLLLMLAKALS